MNKLMTVITAIASCVVLSTGAQAGISPSEKAELCQKFYDAAFLVMRARQHNVSREAMMGQAGDNELLLMMIEYAYVHPTGQADPHKFSHDFAVEETNSCYRAIEKSEAKRPQ